MRSLIVLLLLGCGSPVASPDAGRDAGQPADGGAPAVDAFVPDAAADAGVSPFDAILARLADPSATEASLDAVIHEVAFAQSWPLSSGDGRWLFATRWDDAVGA